MHGRAVLQHDLAIDQDRTHGAVGGMEDEGAQRIARELHQRVGKIDQHDICRHAGCDAEEAAEELTWD